MTIAPQKEKQDLSNLMVRLITAVVGAPLALAVVYLGGWPMWAVVVLLASLALLEFYALGRGRNAQGHFHVGLPVLAGAFTAYQTGQPNLLPLLGLLALAAAVVVEALRRPPPRLAALRVLITIGGLLYVGVPSLLLIALRARPDGLSWLVLVLLMTWGTDTLAFVGGRLWGRRPLAPRVSPRKTVEGAAVGIAGGLLLGLLWALVTRQFSPALLPLLLGGPPAAVAGDLFESRIKRFFLAGDSHLVGLNIIPGHGGVLDRIDSLIWVVSLSALVLQLMGL